LASPLCRAHKAPLANGSNGSQPDQAGSAFPMSAFQANSGHGRTWTFTSTARRKPVSCSVSALGTDLHFPKCGRDPSDSIYHKSTRSFRVGLKFSPIFPQRK
jgi:hypothetical protein